MDSTFPTFQHGLFGFISGSKNGENSTVRIRAPKLRSFFRRNGALFARRFANLSWWGGGCTTLVGWFLGWKYDPQLYGDYFIGQDKDAVINQSVFSWLMSAKGFETKFGLLATQNILSETSPPLTKYTNSRTCGIPSSPKQFTIAIQTAKQQPFDFFSD